MRVREEVHLARRKLVEAGVDDFSLSDLEGMAVMQATLKVRYVRRVLLVEITQRQAERAAGEHALASYSANHISRGRSRRNTSTPTCSHRQGRSTNAFDTCTQRSSHQHIHSGVQQASAWHGFV